MAPVAHQVGLLVPCRVAARAGAGASRSWLTEWDTQFAREVEQGRGGGQNHRLGGQPPRRPRATAPQRAYRWRPAHVVSAARAQLRAGSYFWRQRPLPVQPCAAGAWGRTVASLAAPRAPSPLPKARAPLPAASPPNTRRNTAIFEAASTRSFARRNRGAKKFKISSRTLFTNDLNPIR